MQAEEIKMKKIIALLLCISAFFHPTTAHAKDDLCWKLEGGKMYWYENGVKQGLPGDPRNIRDTVYGVERGREIYDPKSDAWYWLDACYDGAKAVNKEAWIPYIYQSDYKKGINKQGKWVRYDNCGRMIKGAVYDVTLGKWYYYDEVTGEMYKGTRAMWDKGTTYKSSDNGIKLNEMRFDPTTGVLQVFAGYYQNGMPVFRDATSSEGISMMRQCHTEFDKYTTVYYDRNGNFEYNTCSLTPVNPYAWQ